MKFEHPLRRGRLVRRYQRFLADIELDDGSQVTAHCTNSGRMTTCCQPGWPVCLSKSHNPKRKLMYTWEMIHNGTCWIGINTTVPNRLAAEAVAAGQIPELGGYPLIEREKRYGQNSRIDLLLRDGQRRCYVEVKNVTLLEPDGSVRFPDAVTERGRKHLHELMDMVRQGHRAVMLYIIQRTDGTCFRPAWEVDPAYAETLVEAVAAGVELLAYSAAVTPERIELAAPIPILLDRVI